MNTPCCAQEQVPDSSLASFGAGPSTACAAAMDEPACASHQGRGVAANYSVAHIKDVMLAMDIRRRMKTCVNAMVPNAQAVARS